MPAREWTNAWFVAQQLNLRSWHWPCSMITSREIWVFHMCFFHLFSKTYLTSNLQNHPNPVICAPSNLHFLSASYPTFLRLATLPTTIAGFVAHTKWWIDSLYSWPILDSQKCQYLPVTRQRRQAWKKKQCSKQANNASSKIFHYPLVI